MFRTVLAGAIAALSLSAAAAPALAGVVYEQAGTTGACDGACWTSTFGDGVGFRAFDNFTLTSDANITSASWRGFIQPSSPVGPVEPAVENWTVSFYADDGGAPGTQLFNQTFSAAAVTRTFLGVGTFTGQVNVYEFSVDLSGFNASAGTTYWFSPLATQTHFFPFFSWSGAVDPGDDSYQVRIDTGETFDRYGNRAFTLSAVPEPATWAVMLLGFGAAGAMLRRRRALVA